MTSLKNTILYKPLFWLIPLFLLTHLFMFNINAAEWGDSYRILRAAESLKQGFYPADEKRPPLFAYILSLRPNSIDPTTFGRITVLILSLGTFYLFFRLLETFVASRPWQSFGALLFLLNNIYLYWSVRIMSDIPFTFLVMLVLYLLKKWEGRLGGYRLVTIGALVGLSVLTRFEGYLLFVACGLGLVLGRPLSQLWFRALKAMPYIIGFFVIVLPYLIYKNPLSSSYFEETSSRAYDLKMALIFLVSFLYIMGVTQFIGVLVLNAKKFYIWAIENPPMAIFLLLDLTLIFVWPAAIPRLFLPILPLFIIIFIIFLKDHFSDVTFYNLHSLFVLNILTVIFYAVCQYYFKLQFLVLVKPLFILNIIMQILGTVFLYRKNLEGFVAVSILCLVLSSYLVIYLHKNIFISVKSASDYASKNLRGNIAYNDVSSVSDWYLNYQNPKDAVKGFYYNTEKKANLELPTLNERKIDYLLITNEHNTTMTLDLKKRPYLKELKNFSYNVNGKKFTSLVVEVL